jgi:hypothetical protein
MGLVSVGKTLPLHLYERGVTAGDLDFAAFDGQRHSMSRACLKASGDSFADVVKGFGLCPSLRNAAGNRRALGHEHPGFVGL